jgi:hypothetical protein
MQVGKNKHLFRLTYNILVILIVIINTYKVQNKYLEIGDNLVTELLETQSLTGVVLAYNFKQNLFAFTRSNFFRYVKAL